MKPRRRGLSRSAIPVSVYGSHFLNFFLLTLSSLHLNQVLFGGYTLVIREFLVGNSGYPNKASNGNN